MDTTPDKIVPIFIEDEMKESYINYSMSVIVSRALPDVRDGLKPVHRRVLFGMLGLNLRPGTAYKKSARIVGEVLGKYHPHGDPAVYDAMVRMVQDFSMRHPLVDGQGNFGSVDGDPPAAMRYTEVKLTKVAEELLRDIEKDTVDFAANFDDSLKEPVVLPSVLPTLLVNGATGIAVGMATNIPPHNLGEIVNALVALIDDQDLDIEGLMKYVSGPDFPTGGIIHGDYGIDEAYRTGRGSIVIRGKTDIEEHGDNRERIVVSELPYQVNKKNLIEKIAELVREKRLEGISDIRDESDRDGMRMVIELKRDAYSQVVLNNLFKHTQLQSTFGANMLALVDGRPQVLNLKQALHHFIDFRHEVVVRRTKFDLDKAEKRAHILEGLIIALDNIDEIIALIKKSASPAIAKTGLMERFKLSEVQSQAILDMRLQRLTGLEREKIENEYNEVLQLIKELKEILESRELRMGIIKDELSELKERYENPRRTRILPDVGSFRVEDMIADEEMVITISHERFIKRVPITEYRLQNRGGRGSTGSSTKNEDFIEHLFVASTHSYILFFTNTGRCYWLKVHEIPMASKGARGRAIVNILQITKEEKIAAFLKVKDFTEDHFLIMATRRGFVKKTSLASYSRPRVGGINAITIRDDDALITADVTDGNHEIMLATRSGKAIRFMESEVREMGRTASGVKGIKTSEDDVLVGMIVLRRGGDVLVVTETGFGKRSPASAYTLQHRGGKGVLTLKIKEKTGSLVSIKEVCEEDDLMIITQNGIIIRQSVKSVSLLGRNTQGVRLIRLDNKDSIADIARVYGNEDENVEDDEVSED